MMKKIDSMNDELRKISSKLARAFHERNTLELNGGKASQELENEIKELMAQKRNLRDDIEKAKIEFDQSRTI